MKLIYMKKKSIFGLIILAGSMAAALFVATQFVSATALSSVSQMWPTSQFDKVEILIATNSPHVTDVPNPDVETLFPEETDWKTAEAVLGYPLVYPRRLPAGFTLQKVELYHAKKIPSSVLLRYGSGSDSGTEVVLLQGEQYPRGPFGIQYPILRDVTINGVRYVAYELEGAGQRVNDKGEREFVPQPQVTWTDGVHVFTLWGTPNISLDQLMDMAASTH